VTASPILLDVSRLIWRQWGERIPTGIDRVCLAYLDHFRDRSNAIVQFRGYHRILSDRHSKQLFDLLLNGSHNFKASLAKIMAMSMLGSGASGRGRLYLNVGHTGLDSAYLAPWIGEQGLRPVYLIHDLIPITHPQFCRPGEEMRHVRRMTSALETGKGLIFNSRDTARELERFANNRGLPWLPSSVAWLGTEPLGPVANTQTNEPYFVMVGTIEARKNHALVLNLWAELVAELGDRAPKLVIIGQRGWEAEEAIRKLDDLGPLHGKVEEFGRCSDEEMHGWISGARALLMPSFVEGFGLPLIEALQLGTPVIASNLAVFREIAGDLPCYADPTDHRSWRDAILALSSDNGLGEQLTGFQPPTWADHFLIVERFLEAL
jgi:glycosyltransferase involved in cell wall biosynthesis